LFDRPFPFFYARLTVDSERKNLPKDRLRLPDAADPEFQLSIADLAQLKNQN